MPSLERAPLRFILRDSILATGLRWSIIARFMRTRIAQSAAAIPIIGYALLWSQQLEAWMVLHSELQAGQWLTPTGRLLTIYSSAWCLALAWLIYTWRCPDDIRRMPVLEDFLFYTLQTHNSVEFSRVNALVADLIMPLEKDEKSWKWKANAPPTLTGTISASIAKGAMKAIVNIRDDTVREQSRSTILQAWWLWRDGGNSLSMVISATLIAAGLLLAAVPSVEVLWLVVTRVLVPRWPF